MAGQSAAISLAVQPAFSNTTALLSPVTASVAATSLGTTRRLRLRLSFFVGPFDHCDLLTSARTSSAATLSAVQPAFNNPIALLPAAVASTSATLCNFLASAILVLYVGCCARLFSDDCANHAAGFPTIHPLPLAYC